MRRPLALLAGLLAGALLLAACPDDTPATTTDISVTGTDQLRFDPDSYAVPAGEQVSVTLSAEPAIDHDFAIEDVNGEDVLVVHADPGESETGSFTIDDAGTYTVYCGVPGHREAGMLATLEVVDE